MNSLNIDSTRMKEHAYEILLESNLSREQVDDFIKALSIASFGLKKFSQDKGLTEDQTMALLVLILFKATE